MVNLVASEPWRTSKPKKKIKKTSVKTFATSSSFSNNTPFGRDVSKRVHSYSSPVFPAEGMRGRGGNWPDSDAFNSCPIYSSCMRAAVMRWDRTHQPPGLLSGQRELVRDSPTAQHHAAAAGLRLRQQGLNTPRKLLPAGSKPPASAQSKKRKPPNVKRKLKQHNCLQAPQLKRARIQTDRLPNSRLYKPAPPRYIRYALPPPPPPPRPLRSHIFKERKLISKKATLEPKQITQGSASKIIQNLTEEIKRVPKQKVRTLAQKKHSLSGKRFANNFGNEKVSLVVNVPAVNLLSEGSSPERETTRLFSRGVLSSETQNARLLDKYTPSPERLPESGDFDEVPIQSIYKDTTNKNVSSLAESPIVKKDTTSKNSIFKAYLNGSWDTGKVRQTAELRNTNAAVDETKGKSMANKEAQPASQQSGSPELSDGNDSLSAPSEFLAEFLSAIMQRKYDRAFKYCKLILDYEPNNVTAGEFYPLLEEKVNAQMHKEGSSSSAAEPQLTDPSAATNHNTDDKDEASSYDSEDSCVLDDELEYEAGLLEDEPSSPLGLDDSSPSSPSSRSSPSCARVATDSDRSLPSSTGCADPDTDNSNTQSSVCEDEDSARWDADWDNGNAATHRYGRRPTRASTGEEHVDTATTNENYRKEQEELRRSKIQQMRSQFVHSVT